VCGIVAGPLYLMVSYGQAFTRQGFDLTRNAFSYLSLGDLGWIQIANFVLCGLLFVVAATGMRQVLRYQAGGTWGPLLIAIMGMSMIAGGVFVIDPAFGYPLGTPDIYIAATFGWTWTSAISLRLLRESRFTGATG
jgi:hypothetical protein